MPQLTRYNRPKRMLTAVRLNAADGLVPAAREHGETGSATKSVSEKF
jgi:hypothetical protein